MNALKRLIRELDDEEFESLVHQYLLSRFPGAGIRKVDGSGGDKGLDSFQGELADGPSVWQIKNFRNRIKKAQKVQILASIKSVFAAFRPQRWTLCVPIDLRATEYEWFQAEVVKPYADLAHIDLISASDLFGELAHNRVLRDVFFPENAITNALVIRKIAMNMESASSNEKEKLTIETAQLFLEGKIDLEPRLEPILSIGLSRNPGQHRVARGAVFSMVRGNIAIDFFPRDPRSYSLDPIEFKISLTREHSDQLEKSLDAGLGCKLPAGALLEFRSSSPLFSEINQNCTQLEFEVHPILPEEFRGKEVPLRLVAGVSQKYTELSYIPFKYVRAGRREVVLKSSSRLPVEISLTLQATPQLGASVTISPVLIGADVIDLDIVLEFLGTLEDSGQLEIFTLDPPASFIREVGEFSNNLRIRPWLRRLVSDAAIVAKSFQHSLRLPADIAESDTHNAYLLRRIATGESFSEINLTLKLEKKAEYLQNFLQFIEDPVKSIRLDAPLNWQALQLFGKTIECEPVVMIAETAEVIDQAKTRAEYLAAAEGATVGVRMTCKGNCRFVRSHEASESSSDPTYRCS